MTRYHRSILTPFSLSQQNSIINTTQLQNTPHAINVLYIYKRFFKFRIHMCLLIISSIEFFSLLVHLEPMNDENCSPRTAPQDLLVTSSDWEGHQQKHYANIQLTRSHKVYLNHKILNQQK